jgi:hypothetical protein
MICLAGCAIVIVAIACSASAQGAADHSAKVIRIKGSARYTTGNFVWQPIKVGEVLHPGTVVQTSADGESYVDLVLGNVNVATPHALTFHPGIPDSITPSTPYFHSTSEQNAVRIWGDSALGIDRLTTMQTGADLVSETQLDLKRGRMTGSVKKLSAGSKFEVKLPNGVAAVRGTVFDIQAAGIIKVYIGSMLVAWVDPRTQNVATQIVMGGQAYDSASNQVSLLPTDSIDELERLSSELLVGQGLPSSTTLAIDRTLVGMSPVGGQPGTVPTAKPPPGAD